ncbi:MAG TPA: multidrug effflux MFS transporter [Candidatus Krumholzibacteria bacterium]|mgnify:CR=1 FL=1|nr:multidrug effflux MFS transporter [Candidatus Krumholzibacteria bacterium]
MKTSKTPLSLVLALALAMMLGPFSLDTYLPAFPAIGADLGAPASAVALTVSVYIFTLAASQLLGGALSDRHGRRTVLLAGLGIYAAASLGIAAARTLPVMIGGRALQALGGGWVLVSVPALVRDRVSGREAAKLFSLLGLIMVLAPGVAPSVGSALLEAGSWRWIFLALAGYAALLAPLTQRFIFRDLPRREPETGPVPSLGRRYLDVFAERAALPYIVWQTAVFSVLMIFVTNASAIYQGHFRQDERMFSLLFAANVAAMVVFNLANRALLARYPSRAILRAATLVLGAGMLWLVTAALARWPLAAFVPGMMLTLGSMGAISPNNQACYLEHFPRNGGTAAALLGATQFSVAGAMSAFSTRLPETLTAVVLAMAVCAAVAVGVMIFSDE